MKIYSEVHMKILAIILLAMAALVSAPSAAADGWVTFGTGGYSQPAGYWTYQTQQYWVPMQFLGYDQFGHPVYSAGYWATRTVQVWVPAPVYRPQPVYRPHHRTHWRLGFGVSFR